jgi:hypothetical protein
MSTTIAIEIGTDGEIKLDYGGFKDKSCYDAHKLIETELTALGIDISTETKIDKPEMRIASKTTSGMRTGGKQ